MEVCVGFGNIILLMEYFVGIGIPFPSREKNKDNGFRKKDLIVGSLLKLRT
jgi:hypothetical protein